MRVAYTQETHDITQTYGIRTSYGRLIYGGVARPKKTYGLCAKAAMARYTSKITEEDQAGRPISLGPHCTGRREDSLRLHQQFSTPEVVRLWRLRALSSSVGDEQQR
jgi:hypothetical protein